MHSYFSSMTTDALIRALHSGRCMADAGGNDLLESAGKELAKLSNLAPMLAAGTLRLRPYWLAGVAELARRDDCNDGQFVSVLYRALPYAYKARESVSDNAYVIIKNTMEQTRPGALKVLEFTWRHWCDVARGGFGSGGVGTGRRFADWTTKGSQIVWLKRYRRSELQALVAMCDEISPAKDACGIKAAPVTVTVAV